MNDPMAEFALHAAILFTYWFVLLLVWVCVTFKLRKYESVMEFLDMIMTMITLFLALWLAMKTFN